MNFLERIFGRSSQSASAAKERLQFVLAHDRSDISPETLDILKDEIVKVISKHVEIDLEQVEVTVSRSGTLHRLVANIPVLNTRPTRAPRRPAPRPPSRQARAARTKN
ncbi:MAG TPA: cell division topological specificity factor MinE [Anaerolineae bacterium]|jgi:cell division topological specificity factor